MKTLISLFMTDCRANGSIEKALMFCAVGSLIYGIGYSYAPDAKQYLEARLQRNHDPITTATIGRKQTRVVKSILPEPVENTDSWIATSSTTCQIARHIYLDSIIGC